MEEKKTKTIGGITFTGSVTFNGPMFDIHDNEHIHFEQPRQHAPKGNEAEKKTRPVHRHEKPRVTMTLKRKGKVTDGHLALIFMKLQKEEWIDGNDADFKALFSGAMDDDCILTWKGTIGKSTLVELFRELVNTGLIIVPNGFTLPAILEGHFKDNSGQWLTGLSKGDKPNDKGLPMIAWCVKMLQTDPQRLLNGGFDEDADLYGSGYDSYDHQDLRYHTH